MKTIQTAYDMKAVVILTCCDIIEKLVEIKDYNGAQALKVLVETIEHIPTKDENPRCASCGHPKNNHPYRHPFVSVNKE